MTLVTFVTALAPYHDSVVQRAIDSVKAQTVPCEHIVIRDTERRGAGWVRNQGLAQVQTPFVVFLDADDTVTPDFAERTISAWQPGTYVYTDWMQDTTYKEAPDRAWRDSTWHVITALLPTYAVRFIGGFDETLTGAEDAYLYWALTRRGLCGIPLHEPLFHYGKEGQRARSFLRSADYLPTMQALMEKYKDMACCGDVTPTEQKPPNEPFDGAILVLATWAGNRVEVGSVSGRLYARTGNGKPIYVDARDVAARPDLWRPADTPKIERIPVVDVLADEPVSDVAHGIEEIARVLFPGRQPVMNVDDMRRIQPRHAPNFGQVVRLANG